MDQKTLYDYLLRHLAYILGDRDEAIDLSGSDLRGLLLSPNWFRAPHLRGATLNDCLMQDCNLCSGSLTGIRLRGSVLDGADLSYADLTNADLTNACLRGCNLRNAYLFRAQLQGADLTGADMRGVKIYYTDLKGCKLGGVCVRDYHYLSPNPTEDELAILTQN